MNENKAESKATIAATEVKAGETEMKEVPIELGTQERPAKSIYSNSAAFVATPFDLRILFGQIKPTPNGKLVNDQRISVVMSWEHAKALSDALKQTVEGHENDFAPLHYKKRSETGQ